MSSVNFIDYVTLYVRAGHGGAGIIHFRKEKFIPKGGPDGGDGGRGGHILLEGNKQLSNLLHLKYKKNLLGNHGKDGKGGCKTGAQGKDIIIDVPLGTIAKSATSDNILCEVLDLGQRYLLMEGGNGGWGNARFRSATHQAPHYAYPGIPGQQDQVIIELKLLADVGLVGLPNAGKSTLLAALSAARPKIDSYPFTTLVPNLGVVYYKGNQSLVLADIPGIIEGASLDKGLGIRFLKHIERNKVLLLMIAADTPHVAQAYAILLKELQAYSPGLLQKPRLLVLSKIDLLHQIDKELMLRAIPQEVKYICISAITGEGIEVLKDEMKKLLFSNI